MNLRRFLYSCLRTFAAWRAPREPLSLLHKGVAEPLRFELHSSGEKLVIERLLRRYSPTLRPLQGSQEEGLALLAEPRREHYDPLARLRLALERELARGEAESDDSKGPDIHREAVVEVVQLGGPVGPSPTLPGKPLPWLHL